MEPDGGPPGGVGGCAAAADAGQQPQPTRVPRARTKGGLPVNPPGGATRHACVAVNSLITPVGHEIQPLLVFQLYCVELPVLQSNEVEVVFFLLETLYSSFSSSCQ